MRGVTVILPYRNRAVQLNQLLPELQKKTRNVHAVVIAEQGDDGPFNRGAVKNAGFEAAVRDLGLQDTDTVCFHDVDVCCESKFQMYPCAVPGVVHHLYGHKHCLGGVVCMTVGDFRRMGMFPFWDQWGREDVLLMDSAKDNGIQVNHTRFTDRFDSGAATRATGFYEMDESGTRETVDKLRAQLKEKMEARKTEKGPPQEMQRGQKFLTSMIVPTRPTSDGVLLRHYAFF